MTSLELQSSGPFGILSISSVPLLLKWEVSFADLHTSQERFLPPIPRLRRRPHAHIVWIKHLHQTG